jgi:hypothetical protein
MNELIENYNGKLCIMAVNDTCPYFFLFKIHSIIRTVVDIP